MANPKLASLKGAGNMSDEEVRAEAALANPVEDAHLAAVDLRELRGELARARDPEARRILLAEYNRKQANVANDGAGTDTGAPQPTPGDLTPAVLGVQPERRVDLGPAQDDPGAMQPVVIGQEDRQAAPQNKAFVTTPGGAAVGIEPPRAGGIVEPEVLPISPSTKRGLVEGLGATAGGTLGAAFGPLGERAGEFLGGAAGSLAAEGIMPTEHPFQEAAKTGAVAAATGQLFRFAGMGLRAALGKPTEGGQHLLDILQAEGRVPTAGAVLSGSLAKNMQAIGSSDAFLGQKLKQAVIDDGNVVTNRVRQYISGYQRFYGGAKEGFKMWDRSVGQLLGGDPNIVAIDRSVLDKIQSADRVWKSEGAAVDFPLRSLLDRVNAMEAGGQQINAVKVSLEEAEAVRQLLYQRAAALSSTGRSETSAAVGQDVARAVKQSANRVGDDINSAIDIAVRDGKIPAQYRAILAESRDLWQTWKQGEVIQNSLQDALTHAQRSGEPITSETIYSALKTIDKESRDLKHPLITPDQEAHLVGMAKALAANEAAQKATQFTMAIRSGQLFTITGAAAAGGLERPGLAAAALSMTLVPAAMGYIVRNPQASAYLIRGLRSGPNTALGQRAFQQLGVLLQKEGYISPAEPAGENTD